jgi:hypothetical protein
VKTRAQLEEILAAQRARRVRPPAPRKRGRDLVGSLAVILILVVSGTAMFFAVQLTIPKHVGTSTPSPSMSATITFTVSPSTSTATTFMATSVAMKVCTDIPDGRLHVRFAAGEGSEVRGYLAESETVQLALASDQGLDSQMIQGELWKRIVSPVAGWVNARFLCELESK